MIPKEALPGVLVVLVTLGMADCDCPCGLMSQRLSRGWDDGS